MAAIISNGIIYAGGGGNTNAVCLTQEEYDALPDSKLTDGKIYFIEDDTPAPEFTEAAENVFYNGTTGQPDNVQDMLELNSTKAALALTFSPVSASENGQLTNALLVDASNPKAAINAPQKVGYTFTTKNMPEDCVWGVRTVYFQSENLLTVQINGLSSDTGNHAAIWMNAYNNGAWTGWIKLGGVNSPRDWVLLCETDALSGQVAIPNYNDYDEFLVCVSHGNMFIEPKYLPKKIIKTYGQTLTYTYYVDSANNYLASVAISDNGYFVLGANLPAHQNPANTKIYFYGKKAELVVQNRNQWIDIVDDCTWFGDVSINDSAPIYSKFMRYNPVDGHVIGAFYVYGSVKNQSVVAKLPDYIPTEWIGQCGIGVENTNVPIFPRYDSNHNIVSSHTQPASTGNNVLYMIDFFAKLPTKTAVTAPASEFSLDALLNTSIHEEVYVGSGWYVKGFEYQLTTPNQWVTFATPPNDADISTFRIDYGRSSVTMKGNFEVAIDSANGSGSMIRLHRNTGAIQGYVTPEAFQNGINPIFNVICLYKKQT